MNPAASSSDHRLRRLFNGERGLPFKKTEELLRTSPVSLLIAAFARGRRAVCR